MILGRNDNNFRIGKYGNWHAVITEKLKILNDFRNHPVESASKSAKTNLWPLILIGGKISYSSIHIILYICLSEQPSHKNIRLGIF